MVVYGIGHRSKNNRGYDYILPQFGSRRRDISLMTGEEVVRLNITVVPDGRQQRRKGAKRSKRGGGRGC